MSICSIYHSRCQTTAIGTSPNIVSGTGVSTAGRTEWQVIAHEIGHNFGAIVRRAPLSVYHPLLIKNFDLSMM